MSVCACVLSRFSHVRLWDPMDCSPPGSSVQGIPRQEYWSGLPFPSLGDLPDWGIKHRSPALQADTLPSEPPGNPQNQFNCHQSLPCKFQQLVKIDLSLDRRLEVNPNFIPDSHTSHLLFKAPFFLPKKHSLSTKSLDLSPFFLWRWSTPEFFATWRSY